MATTLSPAAQTIINQFLHLPFSTEDISCPYVNNRRREKRGALRVHIGKGSPEEIVQEAKIISGREKINLSSLSSPALKQFLVEHSLGIDCSGLAYYVLRAEVESRNKTKSRFLSFPYAKTPWRKLITILRPAENAGTRTFAHKKNSVEVKLSEVQAGDCIIMLDSNLIGNPNHIMIVPEVEYAGELPKLMHYVHALPWSSDGLYNHGVRKGTITFTDVSRPLIEQEWKELDKTGTENETLSRAKNSRFISLRRLRALV